MRPKLKIYKWEKYWRLTIVKEVEKKDRYRVFLCECECWNFIKVLLNHLRIWNTKSCWCIFKDSNKTHWMYWTKIYKIYYNIKTRCENIDNKDYKHYWWRWIKNEWGTFEDFHKDMIGNYKDGLSIERIDVNGNYNKKNCCWITLSEQQKNKRNTIKHKWKPLSYWCEKVGKTYIVVKARIKYWWSVEDAIFKKVRKRSKTI